jgi:hypothetical protein
MTTKERLDSVDRRIEALVGAMEAHGKVIEAHDRQIEALIAISEENAKNWKNLERRWEAYLNTLPRN